VFDLVLKKLLLGVVMMRPAVFFDWLYRRDWYGRMMRNWAFAQVGNPGVAVLELGSGPGNLSAELAARGWQVTGADRSVKMLDRARRTTGGTARFVEADALALPFEAGTFQVVLSASLINLVSDRPAMLAEIARVLKPGGRMSVLFPTPEFDDARGQALVKELGLTSLSAAALRLWAGAAPKLDPELLIPEMTDAGFEGVEHATTLGGNVAIVSAVRGPDL